MEFQLSYSKSSKMMLWKCHMQYASKFGKSAVATGLEMVSFHSNPKDRKCQRMFKLPHNCTCFTRNKVMLKILQRGFNSMWTKNLQMFKLDLEKGEEPEIKLPTSTGSYKKQENYRKISTLASLTTLKPLTMWITTNCGKFLKRWEYQITLPASWEICMQVEKQPDMEQWTGVPIWE